MTALPYDVKLVDFVAVTPFGSFQISGFSPGEAYNFAFNNPFLEIAEGADGLQVNAATNKRSATLTVNLLSPASSNTVFRTLVNLDALLWRSGVFSIILKDRNSNVEISSFDVQVVQPADFSGGDTAPELSWELALAGAVQKPILPLVAA